MIRVISIIVVLLCLWGISTVNAKEISIDQEITKCTQQHCSSVDTSLIKKGSFTGFFGSLFDTSEWPARWYCGTWTEFHGWMYIGSDMATWLAYFAIPIILFFFLRKKKEIDYPFKWVLLLFILFIGFCGLTHLIDAIIFWWPAYKLSAVLRSATAIVSLTTVFALVKITPKILDLKSPDYLEKKIEERTKALKEANRRLAEVVLEKEEIERKLKLNNNDLEKAKKELAEKVEVLNQTNQSLKEFAYAASHDLQEPLRIINNYSQLLEVNEKSLSNDSKEHLGFIGKAAKRMKSLIDDLLDYSIESQNKGKIEKFNLADVIENVKVDLQIKIDETKAKIKYHNLPDMEANFRQFQRLFQNLISNSVKYRKEDVPPEIEIVTEDRGDHWLVQVKDNGIGIESKHAEKIFQIFYRLHGKDKFEGTGIGLALCKRIVKNHKGDIWAQSAKHEGLTVYFTISKAIT